MLPGTFQETDKADEVCVSAADNRFNGHWDVEGSVGNDQGVPLAHLQVNTMLHIQWNLLYASLTWPRRLLPVVCSCEWDSGPDSSHPWAGLSTSNPKAGLGWAS